MIHDLARYLRKTVVLTDNDGQTFTGKVCDYFYPEDNETNIESIAIDYPLRNDGYKYKYPVEFSALEIKRIDILS